MKKAGSFLEIFCTKAIFLIAAGMFGCFTFWAAKYVHEFPGDYAMEKVYAEQDFLWKNLLFCIVLLVFFYVIQKLLLRGSGELQQKKVRYFVIADVVAVCVFGIIWVTGCHIMPYADQLQVYLTSIDFSNGMYADMKEYFYMCPQQYGLAFLYECVLWIWESYHLIQYINVGFLLLIYWFGYRLSEELFESPRVSLYTVLAMNGFLPLMLYVNFVYGEMGTIAMSLCAIWAAFRWLKTGKKRYMAVASLAMILALLVRKNMIIVVIALAIILIITALHLKNWKACVLAVLLFVLPLGSIRAVELSYEARSGLEVGAGIPNILVVAMGMQQSWQGAGAYNAYNHMVFWGDAAGDSEVAADIAWEYIDGRLSEFAADLPSARYFFQSKIWEQWNVGSMGSLFMTNHFEAGPFAPGQSVYGGELQGKVLGWMNLYLFSVYFMTFVYSIYGLFKGKEIHKTVFVLVAIGGLIFSLLWESKSRYVFPYVVMVLPCMAMGIHICQLLLETGWQKLRKRLIKQEGIELS